MASSKNEAVYAAVGTDFPDEEDPPIAEAIGMQLVEVQAPCDLAEGYQLSVEIHGKQTVVVAVVCILDVNKGCIAFAKCLAA
jgi:hypothetical protein